MKILLIIPAYNEAESLPSLLEELKEYSQYGIIVVDDCSSDNTKKIAKDANIHCMSLPINLGLSGAVQAGFIYGVNNHYDICIQIDGDGQHVPSQIAKLVTLIEAGADIAIGSRFLENGNKYEQTFFRELGAKHIALMIRIFSGLRLSDPTSGMRAFNRKYFERMAVSTNNRPEPDTILQFAREGAIIKEVQVDMRDRMAGESYLTMPKAIKYMIENTLSFLYIVVQTRKVKGVK
ncbi:MAG: glycosyltransferase family 2 protein [Culicoidibacterales bacterium]